MDLSTPLASDARLRVLRQRPFPFLLGVPHPTALSTFGARASVTHYYPTTSLTEEDDDAARKKQKKTNKKRKKEKGYPFTMPYGSHLLMRQAKLRLPDNARTLSFLSQWSWSLVRVSSAEHGSSVVSHSAANMTLVQNAG